jgi:hypothetical protein
VDGHPPDCHISVTRPERYKPLRQRQVEERRGRYGEVGFAPTSSLAGGKRSLQGEEGTSERGSEIIGIRHVVGKTSTHLSRIYDASTGYVLVRVSR